MDFLPSDYEAPKSSNGYMKLLEGENKIRILCTPIIGWEDWKDKKPVRYRRHSKPQTSFDPEKPMKHFWAFIVWEYALSRISILEITQATIRKKLEALSKDADWGAPYHYDIKIIKTGQSVETEYDVNPTAPKELDPKIKTEFMALPIDLEALFSGGDPFNSNGVRTYGFWEKIEKKDEKKDDCIDNAIITQIESEIHTWIAKADPEWRQRMLDAYKIKSLKELKKSLYPDLMQKLLAKKNQIVDEVPF